MPAPDPQGLDIEEYEDGGFKISCEIWWYGNRAHRLQRMQRVFDNIRCGGWKCWHCGEPIPLFKRADAEYCREACRKAVARRIRRLRKEDEEIERERQWSRNYSVS